jgi:hypothetical protein
MLGFVPQPSLRPWNAGNFFKLTDFKNGIATGETTMTLAEIIYQHSLNLPESAAREALDFIEFLEQRYAKDNASDRHWETKVRSLAGTLSDDFPDDIDESDLGADLPREDLD